MNPRVCKSLIGDSLALLLAFVLGYKKPKSTSLFSVLGGYEAGEKNWKGVSEKRRGEEGGGPVDFSAGSSVMASGVR